METQKFGMTFYISNIDYSIKYEKWTKDKADDIGVSGVAVQGPRLLDVSGQINELVVGYAEGEHSLVSAFADELRCLDSTEGVNGLKINQIRSIPNQQFSTFTAVTGVNREYYNIVPFLRES